MLDRIKAKCLPGNSKPSQKEAKPKISRAINSANKEIIYSRIDL